MVHVIVIDEESGEIWTGVQDGRARPLVIYPSPDEALAGGLAFERGQPEKVDRDH